MAHPFWLLYRVFRKARTNNLLYSVLPYFSSSSVRYIYICMYRMYSKKNGEDDLLLGFFSLFHSQLCTVGASSLSALSRVTQCVKIIKKCLIFNTQNSILIAFLSMVKITHRKRLRDFIQRTLYWAHALLNARFIERTLYWAHALLSARFTKCTLYWAHALMNALFIMRTLYWAQTLLSARISKRTHYWAHAL